jgi:hypothetical protein
MKRDVTDIFNEQGYWASFNAPWFKETFEMADYPKKIADSGDHGSYYSYDNCSRYLIFQRDAPNVKTFEEFKALLRQNNYENDTLGNGDPAQQICARYDLRPDNFSWGQPRPYGGLDTKTTSVLRALAFLRFDAIGSPEYETHGPWSFASERFPGFQHDGLPELWNFNWTSFEATDFDRCGGAQSKDECHAVDFCGWCIYDQECMLGYEDGPALGRSCEAGWSVRIPRKAWALPLILSISITSGVLIIALVAYHFKVKAAKLKEIYQGI